MKANEIAGCSDCAEARSSPVRDELGFVIGEKFRMGGESKFRGINIQLKSSFGQNGVAPRLNPMLGSGLIFNWAAATRLRYQVLVELFGSSS
ncbi:unnamed protein product [Linum trigynum]|uniref:Uncharacterized protein n=1 Tax=Linum trigynum TaxID=586398 RepID=A0AAV2D9Q4_9ROSI